MKVAACLIVKDSVDVIERAIDSIRPWVDGIFVYDTGSTDGTQKLLYQLGKRKRMLVHPRTAEVLDDGSPKQLITGTRVWKDEEGEYEPVCVPLAPIKVKRGEWRDDFAWARQQSWDMVPDDYQWAIWLDDDDEIQGAENLRALAATAHPSVDGYVVFYDYGRDENGNCVCQLWRERLIRRSSGLTWKGAVHEVLIPPEGRPPTFVMLPPEQLRYIHHRPDGRYENTRNLEILLADKQKADDAGELVDARTLAYIGTELMAQQKFAEACEPLHAYLEHPETVWGDEKMQVAHKLAACLRVVENPLASLEVEFQALRERDDWAETSIGLMESFAQLGQWDRVERWAKRTLELGMPRSMLILNPLEFTFVPYVRLSEATAAQGRFDEAQAWLEQAWQIVPAHPMLAERAAALAAEKHTADTIQATLRLWETLVRYDENVKALNLLENVPYFVAEHPEIVKARAAQRENCKHYLEPDEYRRWYAEEPKESTIDDSLVEGVGEFIHRAKLTLELAQESEQRLGRKPRILDLGGNDMWMACHLWKHGEYVVDGVELNKASVEKGLARMERFGAPGRLVQGDLHDAARLLGDRVTIDGKDPERYDGQVIDFPPWPPYDMVLMYEVLEHVPDIDRTLNVMESLVAPDGLVCVTTPNGAFEDGNLSHWHVIERKGHLRAIPATELAEIIAARGELDTFLPHDGNRLTFAAYRPRAPKGRVVFYAGQSWEPWSPASLQQGGLGGSETALVQVSTRLAQRGYEVHVYSGAEPTVVAPRVLWRPFTAWDPTDTPDLLVLSRRPDLLDNPIGAKRTALWCHDHSYPGMLTEPRAEKLDDLLVLTEWHRARFAELYPFAEEKLRIVRNGISLVEQGPEQTSRFPNADRPFDERKPRAIYSSSADRGLDVLLELWPRIRERVPDAELHVFYGWNVFDAVARVNPALREYKARILHLFEQAGGEEGGIFMRGRVGQRELADEMQQARVWSYPTAFLETSCIGAMEARAAGLAIVTSELAALRETVGTNGMLLPWGEDEDEAWNAKPAYQGDFVSVVSTLLTDAEQWSFWHRAALRDVDELDWERRLDEWEALVAAETRALVAV